MNSTTNNHQEPQATSLDTLRTEYHQLIRLGQMLDDGTPEAQIVGDMVASCEDQILAQQVQRFVRPRLVA